MGSRVRRALVSVFDKEGIVGFCQDLRSLGVEILSSGGTARLLREEGIPVARVSEYTGSAELLDGRVKTLHPRIHAGILAVRSNPRHMEEIERAGIEPIDLVVVNLYPFRKTASIEGIGLDEVVEMIDVGGPALVRAAAKNFAHVVVVVDPGDYRAVTDALREHGTLPSEARGRLAAKAFAHTSAYDAAVHGYLSRLALGADASSSPSPFPVTLALEFSKLADLRYGENPHQAAAFYRDSLLPGPTVAGASQLQGKELSFNNILDFDAALSLIADFGEGASAIIKHGNPCGVALGREPLTAFRRALECDPASAFGGIVAFNRTVDRPTADALVESFYEGVLAPQFEPEALEALAAKKGLRVLSVGDLSGYERAGRDLRRVNGGLLAQDWDGAREAVREMRVVTRRAPTEEEWKALEFAWTVVRHVKSNAIVYAFSDRTAGIGAGQMSRVDAARFGILKAHVPLQGAAMASDAFFPFRDGIDVAADAGVQAVVQPGGSIRDREVIAAADEHRMTMVLTDRRHFRH